VSDPIAGEPADRDRVLVVCVWCGAEDCPGAFGDDCTLAGPPKPVRGLAAFWTALPATDDDQLVQEVQEPLVVDYWALTAALGRALDHDSVEFWLVVVQLERAFPQFDWKNAMTDVAHEG
jgi:hypothetical protein